MIGVNVKGPKDWNKMKPPPGYVPGLGRGAVGFMTRSDVGSMSSAAGLGRGSGGANGEEDMSSYDQWGGYSSKLFGDTPYEADDKEADTVYAAVDAHMDRRRKRRREEKAKEVMKKMREERPRISDHFADVKSELSNLDQSAWEAIPDVGDYSLKYKQKKPDRFMPVPDSVIEMSRGPKHSVQLDPQLQQHGGFQTPASGTASEVTGMSEARGQMLSMRLDKMSDSVSGQTVVDPQGYLTGLNTMDSSAPDIDDVDLKKGQLLMKSLTTTNPKHAPGWIAAARFEEAARKLSAARKVIRQGCAACPENEDVWIEAARLFPPAEARVVLANAVRHLPRSVKIWIRAASLEEDANNKRIVLRRALEFVPNSVRLWKAAVELEDAEDARIMLSRAVECVPKSVDMWLALARLETYENAKKVLNQARKAIPTEPAIWITAAKLEEAQGHDENVEKVIRKAVASLAAQQVIVDRSTWLKHAEQAEHSDAPITCAAIVRCTIGMGVESEDRRRTWQEDAAAFEDKGLVQCARATYAHLLEHFKDRKGVWMYAAMLEKRHGTPEALEQLLKRAVQHCPKAEILWLMAAKEKWVTQGDVAAARSILVEAFRANPNSEQIWLAAVKLEWEKNEIERARSLLERARDKCSTPRVWMRSAQLERQQRNHTKEEELLKQGVKLYPTFDKLWMMLGQLLERTDRIAHARQLYQTAVKHCPQSVPIWCLATRLEERVSSVTKARSLMQLALKTIPNSPDLWAELIRLEARAGTEKMDTILAEALQKCPTSGMIRAEYISRQSKADQRRATQDAVKKMDADPYVITQGANLLWRERLFTKARRWFNRAVSLDPDYGDAWAWFYKFELENGTQEDQESVLQRCEEAEPRYGFVWTQISKDIGNRHLSKREIVKQVAARLPGPTEPINK